MIYYHTYDNAFDYYCNYFFISAWETEKNVITSVSADGLTLDLENPLAYDHESIIGNDINGFAFDFSAEVALVSRTIKIIGTSVGLCFTIKHKIDISYWSFFIHLCLHIPFFLQERNMEILRKNPLAPGYLSQPQNHIKVCIFLSF